ncbi:MAG: transglycosylase domain-containing protein, partial [Pseudomonadales bacterium]
MWLALSGLCAAVLSLAGTYLYLDPQLPAAETYRHVRLETPLRVYTADERLIAEFGERRLIPVTLSEVPPLFISALLDTEDKRFYEHGGVDFITLLTSSIDLLTNFGEISRGGSTITMQLPRNLGTFSLDQLFIRKFKEILLALKIEQELSKDEILELYINVVPFGKRAYGAQAAALTYYGKTLQNLELPQLAMLAGIPQAPSAGNPVNGPERALKRRNLVLSRMRDQDSIDAAAYKAARAAPITAKVYSRALDVPAAFPAEWVRQQLIGRLPNLYTGGYEVYTTLRADAQAAAGVALRNGLLSYDRRHGYRGAEGAIEFDADNPLTAEQIENVLQNYTLYADLQAAVIVDVSEDRAQAQLLGGERALLDMDSLRWARTFIDVDTRGPAVKKAADAVAVGDIVRIQQTGTRPPDPIEPGSPDDSQATIAIPAIDGPLAPLPSKTWRLAQLPEIQGALVSLNPATGAVLAMAGGFDFGMSQYNHVLQAARQPGSGFKPFVYSAALHHGLTPASIFMDAPLVFDDQNLEAEYRPDNDNNSYNGPTRLREALYRSINLVSMRVLLEVGAGKVMEYVRRFGFDTSTFPRNTQLAIGGGTMAVTPLDMAAAYAVLANGGWRVEPNIIERVIDIEGEIVFRPRHPVVCDPCDEAHLAEAANDLADGFVDNEPANLEELLAAAGTAPVLPATRVIDERNAYIMHTMLQDVIR